VYFPQTLQWVGGSLMMSYQADSDALHDDGWTGGLMGSGNHGESWQRVAQPLSPMLVKSCFSAGPDSIKCLEYPLHKLSPNASSATQASVGIHTYTAAEGTSSGGAPPPPFAQSAVNTSWLHFPAGRELASWGPRTFLQVTDGKVLPLRSGGLLLLLYGKYLNHSKYTLTAVTSSDAGANWYWHATVSHGAPKPCDNPSEHDCEALADGSLLCVWRSEGGTLCR
jgi:hypothetical protein